MQHRPVLAVLVTAGLLLGGLACSATGSPAAPSRASTPANWPTYHGNAARSGYAPSMPAASGTPKVTKRYRLDGDVYASPIVVSGRVVVATEDDSVYAIQGNKVVWRRHLGTPAPQNELPCGNIFPLGITGTPAYRGGLVYATAEFASPPRHKLFALRLSNGTVAWKRSVDLPGVDRSAMQERGALIVAGGRVWVPFGGLAGDCGDYKGRVVGVPLNGSGSTVSYTVPTAREAGIWAPPGAVFDGASLLVAVGNGASTSAPYDKSDSVLKLSVSARLRQYFAPTTWQSDNSGDVDLGSQGPAIVGQWVFAAGKRGTGYVLRRSRLGGIGGQVSAAPVCTSFGGTAVVGSVVYVPCTDGVRAVRIDSKGQMHVQWHANSNITGSPVVGGGRVWSLDPGAGTLYELRTSGGDVTHSVNVGSTSRFATPAIYGRRLFIPTLTGLTVVATS